MAWTDVSKRAIGACVPKSWLDAFIDNMVYLYNALGGSGGSALNIVPNSSFENDVDADGIPDQWTQTLYTGGAGVIVTSDSADAKSCYKFTHPGGAGNGGGYLTSDYVTWSPYRMLGVVANLKCSVAGTKVIVRVKFYDKDKSFISNVDVYTSVANPLLWTLFYGKNIDTPTTARFAKLELHGGVNDTDVAGDVYFDFAQIVDVEPTAGIIDFTDSGINLGITAGNDASWQDKGAAQSITVPAGAKYLYILVTITPGGAAGVQYVRSRIGTTYSSEVNAAFGAGGDKWIYINVSALQGAQSLQFQSKYDTDTGSFSCPTANRKYCKSTRIVADISLGTTTTDAS